MTKSPFAKVQAGDMIQTTKFGAWTFLKRNDYRKNSRDWNHCEGWFLVIETRTWKISDEHPWILTLDLWSPKENYWCDIRVYLYQEDIPKDVESQLEMVEVNELNNPKLLTHIPCVSETK